MKKMMLVAAAATVLQVSVIDAIADSKVETFPEAKIETTKSALSVGAAALIGGLLAGPVGVIAGGVSGVFLGEQLDKADKLAGTQIQLSEMQIEVANLEADKQALKHSLISLQQEAQEVTQQVVDSLTFQVLFFTGDDSLTDTAKIGLDQLVTFLQKYPHLNVRLHGYADPRGTEEYNNVLAMHRAINVEQALIERGVEDGRISRYSYGANQSMAEKGDLDAYALERRVTVEVVNGEREVAVLEIKEEVAFDSSTSW